MTILGHSARSVAPAFDSNFEASNRLLVQLNDSLAKRCPEDDPHVVRHRERKKLTAFERVDHLLDPGSPRIDIAALAGLEVYDGVRPGAGILTVLGYVSGRLSVVVANDATVKGGSYFPLTVKKHLRAQEIALENRLPCFYLVDSGGAFLPLQDEVFPDREHFGRIFYNQARMSAEEIPQVSIVMGSCTAGGAYVPAMSDQAVMVKQQGTIFLGGPPLVEAATGEKISAEDLGGADVHCSISGVADYAVEDDYEALQKARDIARFLPTSSRAPIQSSVPARFSSDELLGLIPSDPKGYFPMREILARLLDDSELEEFKADYGSTLICGFAHVEGHRVGLLANDGILFSESAQKGAHFIQLCSQRDIPLLFLQNIVGFMVGKEYEHRGIAKDGAKLVNAVACASVPKLSFILGGSFGAGNYGMCGRAYSPNFLFAWPNAQISVMGPTQAASVLTQVRRNSLEARGKDIDDAELEDYRKKIESSYLAKSSSWYASARLWDDGIIDPRDTRSVIDLCLQATKTWRGSQSNFGVFRM